MAKAVQCIETEIIYKSYVEAATATGTTTASLCKYFNGELKSTAGYHWRHINSKHFTNCEKQNNMYIEPLSLKNEIWKPITFAPSYEVSSFGRVKSCIRNPKIVKMSICKNRVRVNLRIGNKYKLFDVGRLVLMTFCPVNNMEDLSCKHIDGNFCNNNLNNLEWGDLKFRRKIIRCVETGVVYKSITDASKSIKVSINSIDKCINHKRKTAGGYHWEVINHD